MKIGIDARIYSGAGIARYTRNLIAELERTDHINDYVIFISPKDNKAYIPGSPNFKKWIVDAPPFSIKEQTSLLLEFYRADLDLLHVPNFNVPLFYTNKTIVTIHDFTMLDFDKTASTHNEYLYIIKYYLAKFIAASSIKKAERVICPTNQIKKEVLERYGVQPSKVVVTYEGGDYDLGEKVQNKSYQLNVKLEAFTLNQDEKYILYVGSSYPHKNLETLILAFKDLIQNNVFSGKLVLAGQIDNFAEHIAAFVYGLRLENKIIFPAKYTDIGKLSDEDIATLYKGALCYAFPSKKEGFSLTPLEAQSFGVPVVLSDIPVHQEVFGSSVLYFNPDSPSDLYIQLKSVIESENVRHNLVQAGKINVLKYSWEDMAEKTLKLYQDIQKLER